VQTSPVRWVPIGSRTDHSHPPVRAAFQVATGVVDDSTVWGTPSADDARKAVELAPWLLGGFIHPDMEMDRPERSWAFVRWRARARASILRWRPNRRLSVGENVDGS